MIPTIIIDDESKARITLREMLFTVCPEIEVIGEADGLATGIQLFSRTEPEVIFLDVQMNDGTGFDLLDQLPALHYQVVFVTAFEEYAIKAFQYNALSYLTKPIDPDELSSVCQLIKKERHNKLTKQRLDRLLEHMRSRTIENIALSTSEGITFLKLEEIIRLESDGNYCYFYTADQSKMVVSRVLKEFDDILPEGLFFRTHQSHIVNLRKVSKILREDGGYVLLSDGAKVPISRRKKDDFLKKLKGISI